MNQNDIKIKNFRCSEHGFVKPELNPSCPNCHSQDSKCEHAWIEDSIWCIYCKESRLTTVTEKDPKCDHKNKDPQFPACSHCLSCGYDKCSDDPEFAEKDPKIE